MKLAVICSLLSLGLSAVAKPVAHSGLAVTKKVCGYLKAQPSIESTPTVACLVGIESLEGERLALYSAFDAKVYEINDADVKFSTVHSVTMPAMTIGRIPGVLDPEIARDTFSPSNRHPETADITFNYRVDAPDYQFRNVTSISAKIGDQTYEYENLTTITH